MKASLYTHVAYICHGPCEHVGGAVAVLHTEGRPRRHRLPRASEPVESTPQLAKVTFGRAQPMEWRRRLAVYARQIAGNEWTVQLTARQSRRIRHKLNRYNGCAP